VSRCVSCLPLRFARTSKLLQLVCRLCADIIVSCLSLCDLRHPRYQFSHPEDGGSACCRNVEAEQNTKRCKVPQDNHQLIRFWIAGDVTGVSSSPKRPDRPWDPSILPVVERPERETDHLPPASGAIPPLLLYAIMACSRSFSCVWFLESPG
jgi:hypothetical protein